MTLRGSDLVALACVALAGTRAMALSLVEKNVVDLLASPTRSRSARSQKLSDGIDDRGIPYTEVTLKVSESIGERFPTPTPTGSSGS
jgi:hypothetical protein